MILTRSRAPFLCAVALAVVPLSGGAQAQQAQRVLRIGGGDRCSAYGAGFVELGEGVCGRLAVSDQVTVDGRMRVDPGPHTVAARTWTTNGTADAALRSAVPGGMLPGIRDARHLRVDGEGETYGR